MTLKAVNSGLPPGQRSTAANTALPKMSKTTNPDLVKASSQATRH